MNIKILAVINLILFSVNSVCPAMDLNDARGGKHLAAALKCGKLSGQERYDMARIEYALVTKLVEWGGDAPDRLSMEQIKDSAGDTAVSRSSVKDPGDMHFLFSKANETDHGIHVVCKVKDASDIDGKDVRIYHVFFGLKKMDDGYPIAVFTDKEYKEHNEFMNGLPERRPEDARSIKRDVLHESGIDAVIDHAWKHGLVKEPLKERFDHKAETRKAVDSLAKQGISVTNPLGLKPLEERGFYLIPLTPEINDMIDNKTRTVIIMEDGTEVEVIAHAHSSNDSIYVFLDEKDFACLTDPEKTGYSPYSAADEAGSDGQAALAYTRVYVAFCHEMGVILGQPVKEVHTNSDTGKNYIKKQFVYVIRGSIRIPETELSITDLRGYPERDFATTSDPSVTAYSLETEIKKNYGWRSDALIEWTDAQRPEKAHQIPQIESRIAQYTERILQMGQMAYENNVILDVVCERMVWETYLFGKGDHLWVLKRAQQLRGKQTRQYRDVLFDLGIGGQNSLTSYYFTAMALDPSLDRSVLSGEVSFLEYATKNLGLTSDGTTVMEKQYVSSGMASHQDESGKWFNYVTRSKTFAELLPGASAQLDFMSAVLKNASRIIRVYKKNGQTDRVISAGENVIALLPQLYSRTKNQANPRYVYTRVCELLYATSMHLGIDVIKGEEMASRLRAAGLDQEVQGNNFKIRDLPQMTMMLPVTAFQDLLLRISVQLAVLNAANGRSDQAMRELDVLADVVARVPGWTSYVPANTFLDLVVKQIVDPYVCRYDGWRDMLEAEILAPYLERRNEDAGYSDTLSMLELKAALVTEIPFLHDPEDPSWDASTLCIWADPDLVAQLRKNHLIDRVRAFIDSDQVTPRNKLPPDPTVMSQDDLSLTRDRLAAIRRALLPMVPANVTAVGQKIAPPVRDYTLFVTDDFLGRDEADADSLRHSDTFNLIRMPVHDPQQIAAAIRNAVAESDGKLEFENIVVQLSSRYREQKDARYLEGLKKIGVKFIVVNTENLKSDPKRQVYRDNIYATMLLARRLDIKLKQSDPVLYQGIYDILSFLVGMHLSGSDEKRASDVKHYIDALAKNDLTVLFSRILEGKPIEKWTMPTYEQVTATLFSA